MKQICIYDTHLKDQIFYKVQMGGSKFIDIVANITPEGNAKTTWYHVIKKLYLVEDIHNIILYNNFISQMSKYVINDIASERLLSQIETLFDENTERNILKSETVF